MKSRLSEYYLKYDIVSKLTKERIVMNSGQLICGDGEKAIADVSNLPSRRAKLEEIPARVLPLLLRYVPVA